MRLQLVCTFICFIFTVWGNANAEIRAIVDEDYTWIDKDRANELIDRIHEAGFNTLIVFVWSGRGTSWPSKLAPMGPKWKAQYVEGHDPFAYLLAQAHKKNILVLPAFAVMKRQDDYDIFPNFYDDGTPNRRFSKAYNVHLPEFRQFIENLVIEVVEKYDIDGINLDYIRSLGICHSKYCVNDYFSKYGRNLAVDNTTKLLDKKAYENIRDWNKNAVSQIIFHIRERMKTIKPKVPLTVDTELGSWELQGADAIGWANKKWIDIIFHMFYKDIKEFDAEKLDLQRTKLEQQEKLVLLVNNYTERNGMRHKQEPRSGKEVADLINLAKKYQKYNDSLALYLYRYLTKEQIFSLKSNLLDAH